jgi:hypothetical protein
MINMMMGKVENRVSHVGGQARTGTWNGFRFSPERIENRPEIAVALLSRGVTRLFLTSQETWVRLNLVSPRRHAARGGSSESGLTRENSMSQNVTRCHCF